MGKTATKKQSWKGSSGWTQLSVRTTLMRESFAKWKKHLPVQYHYEIRNVPKKIAEKIDSCLDTCGFDLTSKAIHKTRLSIVYYLFLSFDNFPTLSRESRHGYRDFLKTRTSDLEVAARVVRQMLLRHLELDCTQTRILMRALKQEALLSGRIEKGYSRHFTGSKVRLDLDGPLLKLVELLSVKQEKKSVVYSAVEELFDFTFHKIQRAPLVKHQDKSSKNRMSGDRIKAAVSRSKKKLERTGQDT